MYLKLQTETEQQEVVRNLRGWQFHRDTHGSLYDRGGADSYYSRGPNPHYGGVGAASGIRVEDLSELERAEYMAGYMDNEHNGEKKDYR